MLTLEKMVDLLNGKTFPPLRAKFSQKSGSKNSQDNLVLITVSKSDPHLGVGEHGHT